MKKRKGERIESLAKNPKMTINETKANEQKRTVEPKGIFWKITACEREIQINVNNL